VPPKGRFKEVHLNFVSDFHEQEIEELLAVLDLLGLRFDIEICVNWRSKA
jgi:hypothetical protein